MSRSDFRTLLSTAVAVIVAFASSPLSSQASAAGPMNVVLLVADDLGWADTSLLGHKNLAPTPNLDRLAARGMTFSRAYSASPLCSATRASLMTGLHPARVGIYDASAHSRNVYLEPFREEAGPARNKTSTVVSATRLKTDYFTLAEALKNAGYATGHFGKWHLGRDPYSPQAQGFDVDVPHTFTASPPGGYLGWSTDTMKPSPAHEHLEDRMTKEAIAFLRENRTRPFFLNYWLFSVHGPFEAKPTLVQKYKGLAAKSGSKQSPTYAGMIETMDKSVGLILETLDKLKLSDNTIVIFVSDNGGNVHSKVDGVAPANNGPLRGGKGTLWEGGTRVPCVIVWPGVVARGSFSTQIVQTTDFYPTILEAVGLQPQAGQTFDGMSVVPALKGSPIHRDALFTYLPQKGSDKSPPGIAVLSGDWKLYRFFHDGPNGQHRYELYDLSTDIREQRNLAASRPDMVTALDAKIDAFLAGSAAVVPTPNPLYGVDL